MNNNSTPLGVVGTGVILVIIGYAIQELMPRLVKTGGFVAAAGWVAIAVGAIWFLVLVVSKLLNGGPVTK